MRVFQPAAIDQKFVAMAALGQCDLELPYAVTKAEHPEGLLVPVREIRRQRNHACRRSGDLENNLFPLASLSPRVGSRRGRFAGLHRRSLRKSSFHIRIGKITSSVGKTEIGATSVKKIYNCSRSFTNWLRHLLMQNQCQPALLLHHGVLKGFLIPRPRCSLEHPALCGRSSSSCRILSDTIRNAREKPSRLATFGPKVNLSQNAKRLALFMQIASPYFLNLLRNKGFSHGTIPAKGTGVKIMRSPRQSNHRANPHPAEALRHFANAGIVRNALIIVFVLTLLASWSAISALLRFSDVWQLAVAFPAMLAVVLILVAAEKSRIRNSEALQLKLDRLLSAAEAVHNRVLNLENLSRVDSMQRTNGFSDWSPAMENGHKMEPGPVHLDGTPMRRSETHPDRRNAGAHRITPTGKARS
jgi:low affinity Fe/Cu permease